mmetsp:Transcript_10145/g.16143  ORF Transcript_10145/g.16143 Transcript_10145/m.16143 type:complete len:145 (+) Transcript_10145:1486-1920(+)
MPAPSACSQRLLRHNRSSHAHGDVHLHKKYNWRGLLSRYGSAPVNTRAASVWSTCWHSNHSVLECALLGVILLVGGTASEKHAYPWWNQVARWAFDSVQAFMPMHADFSREESGWVMLKPGSFGGWACNNQSYNAPVAYKVFRD